MDEKSFCKFIAPSFLSCVFKTQINFFDVKKGPNSDEMKRIALAIFCIVITLSAYSQTIIHGSVKDDEMDWPLFGVNITLKNKLIGTISDLEGNFSLETQEAPPFYLVVSSVGYTPQEFEITEKETELHVRLIDDYIVGEEIIISADRVEEKVMNSSVTVEKLGLRDLQQTAAANFFDELYKIKGVDMNVQSLLFRFPNARGFNGETNPRLNQLVDGVNNNSPGLGFAAGNIFGLSQLDIESVEYIIGASSAIYGPGGLNGTLLMTSKNPFDYQGLSASGQVGVMHIGAEHDEGVRPMYDFNLRYAKAINNKLALKVTAGYTRALDWHATDYRDRNDLDDPSLNRQTNPGYDGVNVYGDDIIAEVNLQDIGPGVFEGLVDALDLQPGTPQYENIENLIYTNFNDQLITRTGWKEENLVDYNTENLRTSASLHYKITENVEAVGQASYGRGTSVYSAQNRFSLVDFHMINAKLEIKSPDFYVRGYGVWEDSGDSYDAGATGNLINEAWKPSTDWYPQYINEYTQQILFGTPQELAHRIARQTADNRNENGGVIIQGNPALPLPGSEEFESYKNGITNTPVSQGGSEVIDKSRMYALDAMYNLGRHINGLGLFVGANYKLYQVNSEGTVFIDEPGNPIDINEYGFFAQLDKAVLNKRLELTASARYDKNDNFEERFTPRFSFVYSIGSNRYHKIRGSLQTAFRFPTVSDQLNDIQVGQFTVIGGLPEVQAMYGFDTNPVYPLDGRNAIVGEPILDNGPFIIPPFVPETVTAFEIGYRGLYFDKKLFVDGYFYQNKYNGFLATQNLVMHPYDSVNEQRFQTSISLDKPITSYGWAIGADYSVGKGYMLTGNIAYNAIEDIDEEERGFETRFNTPDYRINMGISNRNVYRNIGFSVNWRWQNDFYWQSSFGNAEIPAYSTLDMQVSYKVRSLKSFLKIGGSNILNQYYTTIYGSAKVGGLYYFSWTFDQFLN